MAAAGPVPVSPLLTVSRGQCVQLGCVESSAEATSSDVSVHGAAFTRAPSLPCLLDVFLSSLEDRCSLALFLGDLSPGYAKTEGTIEFLRSVFNLAVHTLESLYLGDSSGSTAVKPIPQKNSHHTCGCVGWVHINSTSTRWPGLRGQQSQVCLMHSFLGHGLILSRSWEN